MLSMLLLCYSMNHDGHLPPSSARSTGQEGLLPPPLLININLDTAASAVSTLKLYEFQYLEQ